MRHHLIAAAALLLIPAVALAQFGGGAATYGQGSGHARATQNELSKRTQAPGAVPPSGSMFLEASVLLNTKADAYVAVFGLMQEGTTPVECQQKMDAAVSGFAGALAKLGVRPADTFVDFVTQNRIYGYDLQGDVAKERVVGFELKKNVSVHFKDYGLLDRLVAAAADLQIYDLVKLDYVLTDIAAVRGRLMDEAAKVLKQKAERYRRLMGIPLGAPMQVYAELPSIYYPSEMYDSYAAYEAEGVSANVDRQKYVIQSARKSRTFYFHPLDASGFDAVVNPLVIEPVVQCTLYVKARYSTASASAPPKRPRLRTKA